jgi:hypothetical protein
MGDRPVVPDKAAVVPDVIAEVNLKVPIWEKIKFKSFGADIKEDFYTWLGVGILL